MARYCVNGHEVDDQMKFCPQCGAEIVENKEQKMFCEKCGHERVGAEKFCPQCGTSFAMTNDTKSIVNIKKDSKKDFRQYLPFIIVAAIAVFGLIGYYATDNILRNEDDSLQTTDSTGSSATDSESSGVNRNVVIADYDGAKVYSGDYIFDAVLGGGFYENEERIIRMEIEGNSVSIYDDEFDKCMKGHIYNNLNIEVLYDYGNDMNYLSMSINPTDKEGVEWSGEYRSNAWLASVDLKLKECRRKGEIVKINESKPSYDSYEEDDMDDEGTSQYSSNTSSSFQREFMVEQYVTMYLANQTFRSNDGFTIKFDGSCRMYAEGDYAGVVSVLSYTSTRALIRYGGGQYSEGKMIVIIVGDKLQLIDPVDGTSYYQK